MNILKYKILTILLLFLLTTSLLGQEKGVDKSDSYFSASLNYISNTVFMGRKDSISTPYLNPSLLYHNKSGFYVNGSLSYLTKSNEERVDLYLLTMGLDFNINNFYGDLSATKYFFNDKNYTVISQIEADLTLSLLYDFKIFDFAITSSAYFSKNSSSDFFISSEISHDFLTTNNSFKISPTAGIYLGSQNFYQQYYIYNRFGNRSGSRKENGFGSGGNNLTTSEIILTESEKFDIMTYEISIPISYTSKSFTFLFLPVLTIPQNEPTITIDDKVYKEELKDTFYWILSVAYNFY